ncbi:hypothetical protein VaNZ11_009251 [Volvox africanus]|uniref:J domain-containing protein n=1 Tax=Volvox africanus TaxID=51714 RepID=A0ABQ5S7N0_9CHLO|nr:hypothetical protein VaNZ11_009251 [Volvox africanus]
MAPRKQHKRSAPVATGTCPDLYAELGLARNASVEDIKRAYRRLALQCHPDKCPGDEAANERFQRISMAYSVLSDQQKRRYYDQTGTTDGLDISPDEFLDMFQSLLLEIIGGTDMIRAMLSCFTPRELARLPPFPFPKELFPPGTFPPGLRFSCKGMKGLPPQIDELIQSGDLRAMFATMSGLSPPSSGGRTGRNAGSSNRRASSSFASGCSHAPLRDPFGYGRLNDLHPMSSIGGSEFRDRHGGSSIGSSDSEWTDVSESELEAVLAQQRGLSPPAAERELSKKQDDTESPPLSARAAATAAVHSARSPAGGRQLNSDPDSDSGWATEDAGCAAEAAEAANPSFSSPSPLQVPSVPRASRHPPTQQQQQQQQQQQEQKQQQKQQQFSPTQQQQLIRDWMMAARSCDVGALTRLLEQDPRLLDCRGTGMGHTALHWCAAKGSVECVGWLLQQGTDVNVRNDDGATPLHAAARNGRLEAVEALLAWRGHPAGNTQGSRVASHSTVAVAAAAEAAFSSNFATSASAEATAAGGAAECDLEAVDGEGRTALRLALEFQHDQVAALLLRAAAERGSREGGVGAAERVVAEAPGGDTGRNVAASARGACHWPVEGSKRPPAAAVAPAAPPLPSHPPALLQQRDRDVAANSDCVDPGNGPAAVLERPQVEADAEAAALTRGLHCGGGGVAPLEGRVTDGDGARGRNAATTTTTTSPISASTMEMLEGLRGTGWDGGGSTGGKTAAAAAEDSADEGVAGACRLGSQMEGSRSSHGSSREGTTRLTADGDCGTQLPQISPSSPPPPHQHNHNQAHRTTTTEGAASAAGTATSTSGPGGGDTAPATPAAAVAAGAPPLAPRSGLSPEEKAARRAALLAADAAAELKAAQREAEKAALAEAAAAAAGLRSREEGKGWLEAARRGDLKALRRMLTGNPRLLGYQGQGTNFAFTMHSALHWAVAKGHTAVARWLLQQGADPDMPNAAGATPLHAAARQRSDDCARLLVLEASAKMAVPDSFGETARDILLQGDTGGGNSSTGSSSSSGARLVSELEFLARVAALRDSASGGSSGSEWTARVMRGLLAAAGVNPAGLLERRELVDACKDLIARYPPRITVAPAATAVAATPSPPRPTAGNGKANTTPHTAPPAAATASAARQTETPPTIVEPRAPSSAGSSAGDASDRDSATAAAATGIDAAAAAAAAASDAAKQRGNEAFSRADYPKAVSHYTMAIRLRTEPSAVLYSNRAAAYCGMRYFGKAQADAEEAIRLDPQQPKYRCRLGVSLLGQQQLREAEAAFRAALQLDPSYSAAIQGLQDVRAAANRTER